MNQTLFLSVITINAISIILTFCLLSFGGEEINPIANKLIQFHPYIFLSYVFFMWGLMYYFNVCLPFKIKNRKVRNISYLCLLALLIWFLIDASHNFLLLIQKAI